MIRATRMRKAPLPSCRAQTIARDLEQYLWRPQYRQLGFFVGLLLSGPAASLSIGDPLSCFGTEHAALHWPDAPTSAAACKKIAHLSELGDLLVNCRNDRGSLHIVFLFAAGVLKIWDYCNTRYLTSGRVLMEIRRRVHVRGYQGIFRVPSSIIPRLKQGLLSMNFAKYASRWAVRRVHVH